MKKVAWGQDFSGVKPRERERGGGGGVTGGSFMIR